MRLWEEGFKSAISAGDLSGNAEYAKLAEDMERVSSSLGQVPPLSTLTHHHTNPYPHPNATPSSLALLPFSPSPLPSALLPFSPSRPHPSIVSMSSRAVRRS